MKKLNINQNNKYGTTEISFECIKEISQNNKKSKKSIALFFGAIIGFINGFWGGGGGMVCVPILMQFLHLPEKKAHATTLLIMLPMSIASLVVYFINGNLPFDIGWQIGLGFITGGILGALILKKINNFWLGIVFSIVIIVGGIKMLI